MTLRPLTRREYLVLEHFKDKRTLAPEDCETEEEYNLRADIALKLFNRDLLLSRSERPYRPNNTRADLEYLEVGILRPSPSALRILKHSYGAHIALMVGVFLVSSGALFSVIGLLL
jgi:hypothetical protein